MTPTRRLVAVVVAAMLVWSVAFGGGYTVALFTANATVSGTFETADMDTDVSDTTRGGDAGPENATNGSVAAENGSLVGNGSAGSSTESVGNGTEPDGNVTDSDGSGTHSDGNVTDSDGNVTDSDGNVTDSDGNVTDLYSSDSALAGESGDADNADDELDSGEA